MPLPPALLTRLQSQHEKRAAAGLERRLTPRGRQGRFLTNDVSGSAAEHARAIRDPLLDLASNDYLGLSHHPAVRHAVAAAATEHGVGAAASRLITGTRPEHQDLERRLAELKDHEAALVMATGYTANLAVLATLPRRGDLVLHDRLNHASLFDASRASAATTRTFRHRDLAHLNERLHRFRYGADPTRIAFVATDAVFSMDGDVADLPGLLDCCRSHDAVLVVDEAHATGVLGPSGAGLAAEQAVAGQPDILITTASKALGSLGGAVSASQPLIDALINTARPFIYSTGVPPTQVAGIHAALDVLANEPQHRQRLRQMITTTRERLVDAGCLTANAAADPTPIIPLIVGDAAASIAFSDRLAEHGILAPAIRPPTVPPGTARVRLSLRSDLTDDELERVIGAAIDAFPRDARGELAPNP